MSYAVRRDGQGWRSVDGPQDCGQDESYQDAKPGPIAAPTVPQVLTPIQALTALDQAGLLESVDAYMSTGTTPLLVRRAYAAATAWRRDSLLVASAAAALNLSSGQVDALFVAGASIEV